MEQAGKDRWNGYQVIGPKLRHRLIHFRAVLLLQYA
jgi:hypothetical protein